MTDQAICNCGHQMAIVHRGECWTRCALGHINYFFPLSLCPPCLELWKRCNCFTLRFLKPSKTMPLCLRVLAHNITFPQPSENHRCYDQDVE
jgi:hypothetical protein